jgi:hypothetical protein
MTDIEKIIDGLHDLIGSRAAGIINLLIQNPGKPILYITETKGEAEKVAALFAHKQEKKQ